MTVDLDRQLKIPSHITQTSLRPDIILVSEVTRQLILTGVDCTLGRENGKGIREEEGRALVEDCCRNGRRTVCLPVDSRGSFPQQGLPSFCHHSPEKDKSHHQRRGGSRKGEQVSMAVDKKGLSSLGWVAWTRVSVVRPETPNDSRQH